MLDMALVAEGVQHTVFAMNDARCLFVRNIDM